MVNLVLGTQWGDEGKAKVVDYMAEKTDIVIRYQGGANAGHTVKVDGKEYVFHLIPSGILYPKIICILGGGMVIDADAFFSEIETLNNQGIVTKDRIRVADNAHLLLPYHSLVDAKSEGSNQKLMIGTTKKGIGSCYSDKINRFGIRLGDLLDSKFYENRLPALIEQKNILLKNIYNLDPIDLQKMIQYLKGTAEKFEPFLVNVSYYLNLEILAGCNLLLEGAQGTMLDVDHGTYPYVTSSNPTTGGALIGSGIQHQYLSQVIGITKAYATRVGEGPFPTEAIDKDGEKIREVGKEYGATTGRPRRCGWFDVEIIRHSARINGLSSMVLTKLDVFDNFDSIKVCIGYEWQGNRIDHFPSYAQDQIKPIYETIPGWRESIRHCRKWRDLPKKAQKYVKTIEKFCGTPIKWVSVGPSREETIQL